MRYVLLVSYDGTAFNGFQKQKSGRTVQGALEEAAAKIFGAETRVAGSGRTDAGVHARGQVCHLDAQTAIPAEKLRECFNRILPDDLRILRSAEAPAGFDCTRGAKRKTYCYRFYFSETQQPLLERYSVRIGERPDLSRMRAAAELIVGEHDFKAFCASGSSAKTSVRTVYSAEIEERKGELCTEYALTVCGNGFLYNMVRIIAGEVIAVGCGKEEGVSKAFLSGGRALLAKTMPAKGLTLERVEYCEPPFGGEK